MNLKTIEENIVRKKMYIGMVFFFIYTYWNNFKLSECKEKEKKMNTSNKKLPLYAAISLKRSSTRGCIVFTYNDCNNIILSAVLELISSHTKITQTQINHIKPSVEQRFIQFWEKYQLKICSVIVFALTIVGFIVTTRKLAVIRWIDIIQVRVCCVGIRYNIQLECTYNTAKTRYECF